SRDYFFVDRGILAIRLPGFDRGGSRHSSARVPALGAALRSAGERHLGVACPRCARSLSASRQHCAPVARRRTQVFLQQEGLQVKKIAILGAGSWGTALALVLSRSRQRHRVSLWVHDPELAEFLRRERVNSNYLPDCKLPDEIAVTNQLGE